MPWQEVRNLVVQPDVRMLCRKPYEGHPRGCPNYDSNIACPPGVRQVTALVDVSQPMYAVWSTFDLGGHVVRMLREHPDWSERQAACCLYWQGQARKALGRELLRFLSEHLLERPWAAFTRPEALGVNVTETMAALGVTLEWPPKRLAYQVALVGKWLPREDAPTWVIKL